jgi:hypothetical protein
MTPEQQDQVIDSCVTIVTNGSGPKRAIPARAKPAKTAKKSTRGGRGTPFTVKGENYTSFASFCEKNNLKKNSLYPKFRKVKTAAAKIKFLEKTLDS